MEATTMKMVFWGVFAAGFVACSMFGIGPVLKRVGGDWTSPWMLAGVALGVAIVALAVAFVTGYRPGPLGIGHGDGGRAGGADRGEGGGGGGAGGGCGGGAGVTASALGCCLDSGKRHMRVSGWRLFTALLLCETGHIVCVRPSQ